jgi:hypothetical protein
VDSSGNIHHGIEPAEAIKRGMVPIPPEKLAYLKRANRKARRAWFRTQAAQAQQLSQAPADVAMRADERRVTRNKRKAAAQRSRA